MSYDAVLRPGDVIRGRWLGHTYLVEQELGAGANGRVYLVLRQEKLRCALKIGYDALDFQSEINGLSELHGSDPRLHRYLLETDDLLAGDRVYPFYVMRYVHGVHPGQFLRENGMDWFPVIGYRILTKLTEIHTRGYIFGDLKSDNILVSGYGTTELIDYGGLSKLGRSVRQYTEMYDRGYWRAGTRTADFAYDLFAFAMICLELADADGAQVASMVGDPERNVERLAQLADELPASRRVAPVIQACLEGRLKSAVEAQQAWRSCVYQGGVEAEAVDGRRSRALTAVLAVSLAVSAAVFGMTLYWTISPG